jgi:hypothetical protein
MGFKVVGLNPDFSDNEDVFLGVFRRTSNESGFATCLVSNLEFKGNARFKLGDFFVYPSIQASVWAAALGEEIEDSASLSDHDIFTLMRWPAIDSAKRLSIARELGLEYFPATSSSRPTKKFNNVVSELFELAQDFVIPQIEPNYISIENYVERWKKDPNVLLLEDQNLDLAIASKQNLNEHIATLARDHVLGQNKDFTRVMSGKMTNVLTQQRRLQTIDPSKPEVYLTLMESLGVRRAMISDTKLDVGFLRRKNAGKTYTVYFSGE